MSILDRIQLASFVEVYPGSPPGLALWARRTAASDRPDFDLNECVDGGVREAAGDADTSARRSAQSQRL